MHDVCFWHDPSFQSWFRILFICFVPTRKIPCSKALLVFSEGGHRRSLWLAMFCFSGSFWSVGLPLCYDWATAGMAVWPEKQASSVWPLPEVSGCSLGALSGFKPRLAGLAQHQNNWWAKLKKTMCFAHVKNCSQPINFSLSVIERNWYDRYKLIQYVELEWTQKGKNKTLERHTVYIL